MPHARQQTPTLNTFHGFLSELEQQRHIRDQEAQASFAAHVRRRQPGQWTRQCLEQAAYGTDADPIGHPRAFDISISSITWAPWILDAARAFAQYPGLQVLRDRPLPDKGDGIDSGQRIFELASIASSADEVANLLDTSRAILGPHQERPDRFPQAASDSEYGIRAYFRQLYRYFDGVDWSPPTLTLAAPVAHPTPPSLGTPLPAQPEPTGLAPLSPALEEVWNALKGEALSDKQLATTLSKPGHILTAGAVRASVRRLRAKGRFVAHSTLRGYYRKDALPNDLTGL